MKCPVTRYAFGFPVATGKPSKDGVVKFTEPEVKHSDDGRLYYVLNPKRVGSRFACEKCLLAAGAGRGAEVKSSE